MQSIPKMQEVGGVRGRYLPQAMLLPQEHAIALTIGRIIIWGTVNAIPQRTLEGLMAQISLTSANLGEKYHGAWFASIFSGMATLMCERLTRSRFNDPPMNLPFPSAFRVVWDGITLQNGATIIPTIVVFTDYTGRIVSELVDAPISKGSSGMDVAALVHGVLERKLSISKKVLFRSGSSGASQASMQRERMSGRCDLLTSMLVDRAYSGKTGNKADAFLGELFGLSTRVGLADKLHCCTSAANGVWSGQSRKAQAKAKAKSKATNPERSSSHSQGGSSSSDESSSDESSSSSSSGESANIRAHTIRVPLSVGPGFAGSSGPLNATMGYQASLQASPKTWEVQGESVTRVRKSMGKWANLCKSMAKFFGRGINRTFLARAYHEHGVKQCPRILAPLKVRMVVYCGEYLSQSMRHHAARAQAILLATGRLEKLCNKAVNKAWAGSKDAPKKLRRARAMGQLLCSPAIQLPLLVNDLLHLPAGYQQGCLVLQQTCAVFFPLHLCAAQMWWQLSFSGVSAVGAAAAD